MSDKTKPPKLPGHVDVGPHQYTITVDKAAMDGLSVERRKAMTGETDSDALTITMSPDVAESMLREVALHETLHAILAVTGLADPTGALDGIEEQVIVTLALALLDVLRRNPELVAYLTA